MGLTNCCEEKTQHKSFQPKIKRGSQSSSKIKTQSSPKKNQLSPPIIHYQNSPPSHTPEPQSPIFEKKKTRGPDDYQPLKYLGKGAFGCVVLAQQKATNRRYAMKIIEKNKIKQFNLLQCDRIKKIGHENFLVTIKQTFQNKNNIYIIMEYLPMGDLYYYLKKRQGPFDERLIANIVSEIIVSIDILHKQGIVYRELKPQNLLVTQEGHIKLTDYGLSKVIIESRKQVSTFIGTLQYMAPQAYSGDFGQKADIWSLGILMHQLLFKESLFEIDDQKITTILKQGELFIERSLIESRINSHVGFLSKQFRDLLLKILDPDPYFRIGLQQIKNHEFFKNINWADVQQRKNDPPLKELKEKKNMIRFRDPATQKYFRRQFVKERTLKQNYEINLYQFRNSK